MTMHGDAANAKACAKVQVREWLSRWGVPDIMTSDRGSQFVSYLWLEVCRLMGIARDPTTRYHPQHIGNIERMHSSLKNSLRARLLGRVNWLSELPCVMLDLSAASNLDTRVRRRFWSLVSNPHYRVSWWYREQQSMTLPSSAENWRLLRQLKHSTRTHGTRNVEVARTHHATCGHQSGVC